MRYTTTIAALALAAFASAADAQTCLGTPSFATGPLRLEGGFRTGGDATAYGVGAAVGAKTGPFASVGVSIVNIDEVDESATMFSALGGWDLGLAATRSTTGPKIGICPVVAVEYQNGPNFETEFGDLDLSATQLSAGVSVGAAIAGSPTMSIIPFGTIRLARTSVEASFGGESEDDSENHGLLDLGVGFAFSNAFTIRPNVQIPLGLEDSDTIFGVVVSYNFKRSR